MSLTQTHSMNRHRSRGRRLSRSVMCRQDHAHVEEGATQAEGGLVRRTPRKKMPHAKAVGLILTHAIAKEPVVDSIRPVRRRRGRGSALEADRVNTIRGRSHHSGSGQGAVSRTLPHRTRDLEQTQVAGIADGRAAAAFGDGIGRSSAARSPFESGDLDDRSRPSPKQ